MKDVFGLANKVVVITGGGGILCSEIAISLAKIGLKIAILDLIKEKAEKVKNQIISIGGKAIALAVNVLDKKDIFNAKKNILKEFNQIDILINGAGGSKKEATTSEDLSFFNIDEDAFREVFDLNFMGTFLPSQIFGQYMAEKKEGVILNISSMAAFCPLTKVSAYCAAKAAINNFTQWLAVHMAQNYSPSIRVNAIAPGFFLTEQNKFLLIEKETGKFTPRAKTIIKHTPQARFGKPQDLIGGVLWLISPLASFVTGTIIPIDGGFSAYSGV